MTEHALKEIMQNLVTAIERLPSPKLDNLHEWDNLAPPIISAAEAVAMTLRERDPQTASIIGKVAADCVVMRDAIMADSETPPDAERLVRRDVQLLEMQAALRRSCETIENY